jgi:hypothetical protein
LKSINNSTTTNENGSRLIERFKEIISKEPIKEEDQHSYLKYYIVIATTIVALSFIYVYSDEINQGITSTIE